MILPMWLLMFHCAIQNLVHCCSTNVLSSSANIPRITFSECAKYVFHFLNVQNMCFTVALSLKCPLPYQSETDALFQQIFKKCCPHWPSHSLFWYLTKLQSKFSNKNLSIASNFLKADLMLCRNKAYGTPKSAIWVIVGAGLKFLQISVQVSWSKIMHNIIKQFWNICIFNWFNNSLAKLILFHSVCCP